MKPDLIEVRFKNGIRFMNRQAADLATEHLGGIEIHPIEKPIELKKVPRTITEPVRVKTESDLDKQVAQFIVAEVVPDPGHAKVNEVASAMEPKPKAKRKPPVKSKTTKK